MIFLDTNVVSESSRKTPDPAVTAWLVRHDAEPSLPTVTIAEIAYEAGFNDLSHFYRAFRRRFGETPAAARTTGRRLH